MHRNRPQVANPVVVQQQPTVVSMSNAIVQPSPGDNYYTLSIIMTILVILLGGWLSIVCTAMAALISYNVSFSNQCSLITYEMHF